jgi:mono/diheme cytochrome c family protein
MRKVAKKNIATFSDKHRHTYITPPKGDLMRFQSSAFLRSNSLPWKMLAFAIVLGLSAITASAQPARLLKHDEIKRGRYLVEVTGCNDCHTPGYTAKAGEVRENLWLTGDTLGWSGPWGTTYATNLRLYMANMTQAQWLAHARSMKPRPPMPWFNLRAMTDADLKAIHTYTVSLGQAGIAAPSYMPPGQKRPGPVVEFPQ